MNPYRKENLTSVRLSIKDKLYLSGNPIKRGVFYIICCLQGILAIAVGTAAVGAVATICNGIYHIVLNYKNWFSWTLIGLSVVFILWFIAYAVSDGYDEKLKKKLENKQDNET